ncbi:MAG: tetratricopeptide repeat protein [Acidobacteriota bacterium]
MAIDGQGAARCAPYVEKAEITFPALVDRTGELWDAYDFKVVPVQLFFDETGRLVYKSSGGPKGDVLERLDEALKQPPMSPEARAVAAASATADPPARDAAAALFARGVAALDAGRRDEALSLWQEALEQDPDNWLIRKQVWTLEAPDRFWGEAEIDYGWQKKRMAGGS